MANYNHFKLGTIGLTTMATYVAIKYPEAIKNTTLAAYNRMAPIVARALNPVCTYLSKVGTRGVTILSGLNYNPAHTFSPFAAAGLMFSIALVANVVDVRLAYRRSREIKISPDSSLWYANWFQANPYKRLAISHVVSGALHGSVLAVAAKVTGAAFGATLPGAIIALTAGALLVKVAMSTLPASVVGQQGRFSIQTPESYYPLSQKEGIPFANWLG